MRIGFSNINPYYEKFKKDKNNKLPEDFFLDDKKNNKAKLEVRREQGFIKQYIILPDGKRKLISVSKETDETKKTKEPNNQISDKKTSSIKDNNKNSNTKELMQMLNHSVGAGLPLQLIYQYTKK